MGVKFGTEEGTDGPLLHAKFHPHRCNVSPLRGEKPQNRPLSKLNTGRFALRAMLPVTNVKRYQTHYRWQYFFQGDSIVRATQSNCCNALDYTAFEWKMSFSCFPVLPRSVEAQIIWGDIVKHLLITYFTGKLSKSVHVFQSYSKPKVGRFFETRCRTVTNVNL